MRGGAQADFEAMFRADYPFVVRTVRSVLGDPAASEDVAQEAFVQLFLHWGRVSRYEQPRLWVRRVALRLAGRARRRQRMWAGLAPMQECAISADPDPDLRRALLALSPPQRAAVVLHYFEGLPMAEVALVLECAEATARVHLHRARLRLGELLAEEVPNGAG